MSEKTTEIMVDLKGEEGPVPAERISQAIEQIELDQILTARATDPGVMMDIPVWCAATGNELLSMEEENGIFTFKVKKLE